MCLSRSVLIFGLALWGFFALSGFGAMSDIASQGVPGYPSSEQRQYYFYIPLFMTCISLLLFAGALWKPRSATIAAVIAVISILLLPVYLFFYTGGV